MKTHNQFMKKALFVAMILFGFTMYAQETETVTETTVAQEVEEPAKKLTISGSVDTYFRTLLTASDQGTIEPQTSFANETGFALGMANIIASYEGEKVGAVADLAFGSRGVNAVGADENIFVNQLYAYWNVSEGTTLTMGRFNTYLGYEVISPVGNFNYSTSYMFSYGPFSHVGLKADFSLSDDLSLMLAVMNITDTNSNLTGSYSAGAQFGYKGQYLNFYYDDGVGIGFEIDYTGGFDLTEDLYLGINAAYQDNDGSGFYGVAIYPQLAASEAFTIGLRGEYFQHLEDGGPVGTIPADEGVIAATLTGSYTIDNFMIKPELRFDSASEDIFPDNDGNPTAGLGSFLIAAIYSF